MACCFILTGTFSFRSIFRLSKLETPDDALFNERVYVVLRFKLFTSFRFNAKSELGNKILLEKSGSEIIGIQT